MGPPPRSSAADAHHCIMVWVFGPPHTRMWHDPSCTQPQLPSDVVIPTTASVPSCSEPSRTRPFGWRYAPSLTAPARAGVSIEWVGTKKRAAQVEQRNRGTRKWIGPLAHPLDKNRPIQGFSDCTTTLSTRTYGRRTKSANGRNRERWGDYGAAGSRTLLRTDGTCRAEIDGAFKRVIPSPREASGRRAQPERAGTDLE